MGMKNARTEWSAARDHAASAMCAHARAAAAYDARKGTDPGIINHGLQVECTRAEGLLVGARNRLSDAAAALHAAECANVLEWMPTDTRSRLYASAVVYGIPLHFIAIEVGMENDIQSAVDGSYEEELTELYALAEPGAAFETVTIKGRSYVVHATPHAS